MRPIVIAAGGTGGHFSPAEALCAELSDRGRRVALLTDARAAQRGLGVFEGHETHVIAGGGMAGHGVVAKGKSALALAAGIAQARPILARLGAAAVVGFGGYPSVAPVLAARTLPRRPAIILHEQNAVLGRANRLLLRAADVIALSFFATERIPDSWTTVIGNPVRGTVVIPYAVTDGPIRLLVLGGSLGARVFSDVVPPALAALPQATRTRLSVMQQCRAEDLDRVRAAYAASGIAAELSAHFTDVPGRLALSHLVIARAGASTVAELAASGRPSILVPLPGSIDDHQAVNAAALVRASAAWVMPQASLTPAALTERLTWLLDDPTALTRAAAAARAFAFPEAAARLADLVLKQIGEHAR